MDNIMPYNGSIVYRDSLYTHHIIAYAVGHFANDLIYHVWNDYQSLFLITVATFSQHEAGIIILIT